MADTVNIIELDIDEKELLKKITKLTAEITSLKKETKTLETTNKELEKSGKQNTEQYKKNSKQIEINKVETKGLSTQYRNNQNTLVALTGTENKQLGTLQKLEISNKQLRAETKTLDLTRESGRKRLVQVNKELDKNNKFIAKNADASKAQKLNIGNYGSALQGLPGPLSGATRGVQVLNTAFKFLLTNPIGLLLVAVALAVKGIADAISSNQAVLDNFKATADGIKAGWAAVTDRLNDLGETVKRTGKLNFKVIVDSFRGVTDEVIEEFKAAKQLREELILLEDQIIGQTVRRAELQRTIQLNRLAVKDESNSIQEQLRLLDEAIAAEDQLIKLQIEEAEERARITSAQVGLGRSLRAEIKAEQEALAAVIQAETDGAKRKIRLASERLTLVNKVAKEEMKIAEQEALAAAKAVDNLIALETLKSIALNEIRDEDVEKQKLRLDSLDALREASAEAEMTLADLTNEDKLDLAQGFLKNITTIFGKGSAIGKAAAVAETAINTFRGAQNAFTSLSGIPIIGVPLGLAAAGAAVKMGVDNVKKILAVNIPGGGGGGGGGSGISGGAGSGFRGSPQISATNFTGGPNDGGLSTQSLINNTAQSVAAGFAQALADAPPVLVIDDVTFKQNVNNAISRVATV